MVLEVEILGTQNEVLSSSIKFILSNVEGQFDFYFKVNLPRPQKERMIIERDKLGRIVLAEVPKYLENSAVDICQ